ncbi:MAG: DNA gyrase inhibitor YacG [Nitrospirota bacterium]
MFDRCPLCHRELAWESNPWRPFCSERCQLTDPGAWAAEQYRIATVELSTVLEPPAEPEPNG